MDKKELEQITNKAEQEIKKASEEYEKVMQKFNVTYKPSNENNKSSNEVSMRIFAKKDKLLPQYATSGSSGLDLRADIDKPVVLQPFERKLIPTGVFLDIPTGFEIQIRAKSGTAWKKGLTLINAIGTIDSDYKEELFVPIINLDGKPQTIQPEERFAQIVLMKIEKIKWILANSKEDFEIQERTGGFGSTGTK